MTRRRLVSWVACLMGAAVVCCLGVLPGWAAGVQVPVPRVTIYPGQLIEQGMLVERDFRSSTAVGAATASTKSLLVGKVARKTLLPGQPVAINAVREPYVVTQGEAALLVFESGALRITGTGVALQSGGTGQVVSVRNADSGRIVKGTVGPDGAVHVGDP
jgi:flagellar basal body P-ring formation protein FlgA